SHAGSADAAQRRAGLRICEAAISPGPRTRYSGPAGADASAARRGSTRHTCVPAPAGQLIRKEPRQSERESLGPPAPSALCAAIRKLILDAIVGGMAQAQATNFPVKTTTHSAHPSRPAAAARI